MKIYKTKEEFEPLYYKGEEFVIIKINDDPNMMKIEARSLRTKKVYGFSEDELEEVK